MSTDTGAREPRRLRVLLAEDDPNAAALLAAFLRRAGHDVEVAPDGLSAVEAARDRPPDVLLLDLGLPRMDGWQVARTVQEQAGPKRPLLVAVTGHGAEEDRRRSAEAGIDLHRSEERRVGKAGWTGRSACAT